MNLRNYEMRETLIIDFRGRWNDRLTKLLLFLERTLRG